jgi:hypothetical protein
MSAATTLEIPPPRMFAEDGSVHFTDLKKVGDSGVQYLHSVNGKREPTRAMLIGTGVHHLVLGARPDAKVAFYPGDKRVGAEWAKFDAAHPGYDILTRPEADEARAIANAVLTDPVAKEFLCGARFEVPLRWSDGELEYSTHGIDIIQPGRIADLKTTNTTSLEPWQRQAFNFSYHCQMEFYRRGCVANGIDVSQGMFVIGVDIRAPYEVVVLEMSEELVELAAKTVSLWIEKLKVYVASKQFPGRAQSPIVWQPPAWLRSDDEEDDG